MNEARLPVIIPVKSLHDAKQRLAPVMPPDVRRQLVLSMLADVLDTICEVHGAGPVLVVTPDPGVAALAGAKGVQVLAEPQADGLNAAVGRGLAHAAVQAAGRALVLPGDVPFARAEEISAVIRSAMCHDGPRVVLVPSRDGGGTNALLLAPPDVIEPSFGPGSFVKHLAAAVARRIDTEVMQLPGLAADIDLPGDLEALLRERGAEPRYASLCEHGNLADNGTGDRL
jgi:2-phospho-L-lactate guanylyltransferase